MLMAIMLLLGSPLVLMPLVGKSIDYTLGSLFFDVMGLISLGVAFIPNEKIFALMKKDFINLYPMKRKLAFIQGAIITSMVFISLIFIPVSLELSYATNKLTLINSFGGLEWFLVLDLIIFGWMARHLDKKTEMFKA